MWQELLHNKYLHSKTLAQVETQPTDSPFWKGLMKVKDDFFIRGSFTLGNGENIRFWEDTWLGDKPLSSQYPSSYNIVHRKQVSVADVLSQAPSPNLGFRRTPTGNKWTRWLHLVERLMRVNLTNQQDVFKWGLTNIGVFTVKSLYLESMSGQDRKSVV